MKGRNIEDSHDELSLAMMKYRMVNMAILSFGGIMSLIIGAIVLVFAPERDSGSAVIEFLGMKVDAHSIGAVIISSSIFWAFFAYRSRPTYGISTSRSTVTDKNGNEKIVIKKEVYDCSVEECNIESDGEKTKTTKHIEGHIERIEAEKD